MAVAGDSSGAHTALMVGFTGDDAPDTDLYGEYSAKVNCIVDSYGPTVFPLMNYFESSQNHYDPESPEGYEIGYKNCAGACRSCDGSQPVILPVRGQSDTVDTDQSTEAEICWYRSVRVASYITI